MKRACFKCSHTSGENNTQAQYNFKTKYITHET